MLLGWRYILEGFHKSTGINLYDDGAILTHAMQAVKRFSQLFQPIFTYIFEFPLK